MGGHLGIQSFHIRVKGFLWRKWDALAHSARGRAPDMPYHERRYAAGVRHFEAGNLDRALNAFTDFLRLTHQSALVSADAPPYGLDGIRSYADFDTAFGDLLDKKHLEWQRKRQPYPRFLATLEAERPPRIDPAGKKILFLIPQYIMNSTRFIEADFKDLLLDSAANAGAQVDAFYTDRCSYPDVNFDAQAAKAGLERLAEKTAAFAPDVIVLDGNYVPSTESLNPAFLGKEKSRHGFKLIAFVGDAWGSHWVPAADAWSEVCDIVFHCAPETPFERECRFPEKLCWSGCPVNTRNFFRDEKKDFDISFVGTYVSGLRPFWLTVALQIAAKLNLKHRLLPHKREAGVALTMDQYAAVLRRSRMVLNFSTRLGPLKMMTGRTWQAMNAGTVLLEEDNAFTSAYFVPFVHFIPFATRNELAYAIEFFSRNPAEAARVGEAASAFCRERYSAKEVWSQLIGAAYAGTGLRDAAAQH